MENHLKLFLPLSLEELGLRKVASLFCSNFVHFFYQSLHIRLLTCDVMQWREATEENLKLGLPESLNKQVTDRVQAIGLEIRKWKEGQSSRIEAEIDLPDISKLCWSNAVGIDCRKIAEHHVLCDRLDNWRRYKTACLNCMESHIPQLWHRLSERDKIVESNQGEMPSLYCLWPYILKGEQSKLDYLWRESGQNLTSFNQWIFEESAKIGNQVAAECFFQKLTPEEREASLVRIAHNVTVDGNVLLPRAMNGSVLFYLLSLMNPEQQMEIVKARPIQVLFCFLDWPRRHLLPENAGLIWTFIEESNYGDLLLRIYYLTLRQREKFLPKFLQEFFKYAPLDFIKKSFVGRESDFCPPACQLLCELVENEDSESIEVMFRHADEASRVKLVFCGAVFWFFYDCIRKEKCRGMAACLREAALSEEDKVTLKESFMRFLDQRVGRTRAKLEFGRFLGLLHETNANDDKEKKVKRLKLQ